MRISTETILPQGKVWYHLVYNDNHLEHIKIVFYKEGKEIENKKFFDLEEGKQHFSDLIYNEMINTALILTKNRQ